MCLCVREALTILQCGDVEWVTAVVSRAHSCVSLHHQSVLRKLPQVCDLGVVDGCGQVEEVGGVSQLKAVNQIKVHLKCI